MKRILGYQIVSVYYKTVRRYVWVPTIYQFLLSLLRYEGRGMCRYAASFLASWVLWMVSLPALASTSSITYATRIDAVAWNFSGSKFGCQLMHYVDGFGMALFERNAGESTHFMLKSKNPRMKSGPARLLSHPPSWINNIPPERLAVVDVSHGLMPVKVSYKISERMLAELQKGMDLQFLRESWYGDSEDLTIVVPSLGFRQSHNDYLQCLGSLLPVNFEQINRKSLHYTSVKKDLDKASRTYLDKVATYVGEDPAVKVIYIDGHTGSKGIRSENLLKSKIRAEKVAKYLLDAGVAPRLLVTRWHGERYQIASNQNAQGRAKNRRVTVRLSKKMPPPPEVMPEKKKSEGTSSEDITKEKNAEPVGSAEAPDKAKESAATKDT